jgi:hypothetical protein
MPVNDLKEAPILFYFKAHLNKRAFKRRAFKILIMHKKENARIKIAALFRYKTSITNHLDIS